MTTSSSNPAQTLLDPAADPTRSKTHSIGGFHCHEIEVFNVKTVECLTLRE